MRTIRKKIPPALLLAVLLILTSGCEARGSRSDSPATEPVTAAESIETEPETAPAEPRTEPETETEAPDTEGAEKAAEALLLAMQTGEAEAIREHIDYRNLLLLDEGAPEASLLAVLAKLTFEIREVSVAGNTAEVTAALTNVDIGSFFMGYLMQSMELEYNNSMLPEGEQASREELDGQAIRLFSDTLNENEANRIETTVVMRLVKTGANWRVRVSEELRDAATGGYFTAREQANANRGM